jgi:L-fucose isomerase-like protein
VELVFFASAIARREAIEASEAWVRCELGSWREAGAGAGGRLAAAAASVPIAAVLTGGTEAQVLKWAEASTGPVILLALPHSNSLPACLEILASLTRLGRGGRIVVADRGDWKSDLAAAAKLVALGAFMRRARVGLLGGPSDWLTASSPAPSLVTEAWGPEVVSIPLAEVVARVAGRNDADLRLVAEMERASAGTVEPDGATLLGAASLYRALKDLASEHRLDALTIRCFDVLGELCNTGCLAVSRLNDEGLTAACEGDLPSLLTMMVLGGVSGQPCFMANPSDVAVEEGLITFAHCTIPLRLVSAFRLRSHFESGIGAAVEGTIAAREMTVARVGGPGLRSVRAFAGEVIPEASRPRRDDLCRTQVTLRVSPVEARLLLDLPLGNHHILTPGRYAQAFLDYDRIARS